MVGKYKVITLCGSTKFKDEFLKAQKDLSLKGNIVISVGLFGHSGDSEVWENMDEGTITKTKEMLDDMHKRKIDMSDEPYFNPNNTEGKDIQKDLQKMIEQLENGLYSKETAEYSEETRELIISSLEHAIKIARMEAKKKFTPNKYKKG